jgi:hypothetical protein
VDLIDPNDPPLTEAELEELVRTAPSSHRKAIGRLCAEVKTLRDQHAASEYFAGQEVVW